MCQTCRNIDCQHGQVALDLWSSLNLNNACVVHDRQNSIPGVQCRRSRQELQLQSSKQTDAVEQSPAPQAVMLTVP